MTFSATPQPSNIPPRVRLDVDSDDPGAAFTSLSIKRDGALIREQPFVGGPEALAFDYEAPFGVPVTYTAEGSYTTFSSVYTTAWPNLTGWSTLAGTPGVTGGKFYSTSGAAAAQRALAVMDAGRLTISAGIVGSSYVEIPTTGNERLRIGADLTQVGTAFYGNHVTTFAVGTGTITATFTATSVTITTTVGSWTLTKGIGGPVTTLLTVSVAGAAAQRVPGFTVATPTAPLAFSASDTVTLDVDEAWLIHPSQPSLSCSIDPGAGKWRDDGINVDIGTKPVLSRKATATVFYNVGRDRPVVKTHGNRLAGEWLLNLLTPRLADRNAVQAIINDETPLLFRAPQDWDWDLPDGWYSVGDVDEARSFPGAGLRDTYRNIPLPLTPSDEPVVRQGALWTWGDVLLNYDTWQDVFNAYPTWLDLLAGPTS